MRKTLADFPSLVSYTTNDLFIQSLPKPLRTLQTHQGRCMLISSYFSSSSMFHFTQLDTRDMLHHPVGYCNKKNNKYIGLGK